ncbi:MAG TPA: hypothetical protein VHR66_10320 [Gemmataceae bacterium]|nr:hypothetical protein [Gemmataceae bacterium]
MRDEGVIQVDKIYRMIVIAKVRQRCPYLLPTDLADVWQTTIYELVRKIDAGLLRNEGSLQSLLAKIAVARGVDLQRKRTRGREVSLTVTEAISAFLAGPAWMGAQERAIERELITLVELAVAQLNIMQRFVVKEYLREYPESLSPTWLSSHLTTVSGSSHHPDQTRMMLKRGLLTVRIFLERNGYYLGRDRAEEL